MMFGFLGNVLLPLTWLASLMVCIFFLSGLYTRDILIAFSFLIFFSFLLFPYTTNLWVKSTQEKINEKLKNTFSWIFEHPSSMGMICFLVLFLSYGLVGFSIHDHVGLDTSFFLQSLSNPYHDGVFLRLVAYASLSAALSLGIKIIARTPDFDLQAKVTVLAASLSSAFWYGICSYEFHELALVPFFYLLIFDSWQKKSLYKIAFYALCALMLKETVTLTFLFSGFLFLFFGSGAFNKKTGLVFSGLGLAFYLLYFKLIRPNLDQGNSSSMFVLFFHDLGSTNLEILLAPVLKPMAWLHSLFQKDNAFYLFYLLFPFLFFLRGGWKILFFAFPTIYYVLLSNITFTKLYRNQYGGEVVIPLCLVAYYGMIYIIKNRDRIAPYYAKLNMGFSIACFFGFLFVNPIKSTKDFFEERHNIAFAYEIENIPLSKLIVTNTEKAMPSLTKRASLVFLENEPSLEKLIQAAPNLDYLVYENLNNQKIPEKYKNLNLISSNRNYFLYQAQKSTIATAKPTEKQISLLLDWKPNTNHTGFYVAKEKGWYADRNLNVQIINPTQTTSTLLVGSGKADFGITYANDLIYARAKGLPVVAIAGLVQADASCFVWRTTASIKTVRDFEGKRYGGWGSPEETAVIRYVMEKNHADFSKVKMLTTGVTDFLPATLSNVDFTWEYKAWGILNAQLHHVDVQTYCPSEHFPEFKKPSPILITSESMIKNHPDVVQAFFDATAQGYEFAIDHPKEAASFVLKAVPELDSNLVYASAKFLAPLYQEHAPVWGCLKTESFENYESWMKKVGLIQKIENPKNFLWSGAPCQKIKKINSI